MTCKRERSISMPIGRSVMSVSIICIHGQRVRPVGLAHGGVTEQGPVSAVILVADDKVQSCEHGEKKSLELQESMTPVGGPFSGTELGPLGLGRKGEGLVVRHSRLLRCCSMPLRRRRAGWARRVPRTCGHTLQLQAALFHPRVKRKKNKLELLEQVGTSRT